MKETIPKSTYAYSPYRIKYENLQYSLSVCVEISSHILFCSGAFHDTVTLLQFHSGLGGGGGGVLLASDVIC